MKKVLKTIFVVLALAVMMAVPTFAANAGWVQNEDKTWSFYEKDGEMATDCFKKSGNDWFWLNEEGIMATNQLVEDGDHIYFVNAEGAMVKNAWVKTAKDEEDEDQWMYFGIGGKAVKDGKKDIGGKAYIFIDNYMQTGFVCYDKDSKEYSVNEDADPAYAGDVVYYCGGEDDGHVAKEEWVQTDGEDGLVWLYFKKNGCKVADGTFDVNGQTYCFAADGAMITGFDATPSVASATIARYAREDGSVVKKGWIWALDEAEEDYHWYYGKGNGKLAKDCIMNIDGKKFAFNENGEMLEGIVFVDDDKNIVTDNSATGWMYFAKEGEEGHVWGSAYTGKSQVPVEDEDYKVTVNFTSYGVAKASGYKDVKGFLYCDGILIKDYNQSWDYKYKKVTIDGVEKYINKSGKIQKKTPKAEDIDPVPIN